MSAISENAPRKILVTCALPYANGPIHLGHMLEHIQADIWVRFQKMRGQDCAFLCADDTHGTPIMVEARKRKITPEELIQKAYNEHVRDFGQFQISHDLYSSTNSATNRDLCEYFYSQMMSKGHVTTKNIDQLYCTHDKMFLPDRFVKGTCPKCGTEDQYGDACDHCSATYSPADLKSPYCSVCGNTPEMRVSEQLMFKVNDHRDFIKNWVTTCLQKEMANKMLEWFNEPLRDWDISRNSPYFGFKIPGYDDKFFYVWVDAPMGYISTTKEYCAKTGKHFDDYWKKDATSEVYHFIGKDITYFHALFWPALLKTADFRTPSFVPVHGHITVNGEKMSKSKGTFISAQIYLNHLDAGYLRYYYAAKLGSSVDDLDLNFEDFTARVNSDLVGKITNLASRGAQMLGKQFKHTMTTLDNDGAKIVDSIRKAQNEIAAHYESREFVKAITQIRELADLVNKYFDEKAPWKLVTTNPDETQKILTTTLNAFRLLAIYLSPVLPEYSTKVASLFKEKAYTWKDLATNIENREISNYEMLAVRIDPEKIKAMVEEQKAFFAKLEATQTPTVKKQGSDKAKTTDLVADRNAASTEVIGIEDFNKVDLRVAKIIAAEEIKEADKLLRLTVDLGPMGQRQIIAGIKSAYQAKSLVGRLTLIVANLAPRKMKFGVSEGMVLAAGTGGKELFIMSPDSGAQPGDKVK